MGQTPAAAAAASTPATRDGPQRGVLDHQVRRGPEGDEFPPPPSRRAASGPPLVDRNLSQSDARGARTRTARKSRAVLRPDPLSDETVPGFSGAIWSMDNNGDSSFGKKRRNASQRCPRFCLATKTHNSRGACPARRVSRLLGSVCRLAGGGHRLICVGGTAGNGVTNSCLAALCGHGSGVVKPTKDARRQECLFAPDAPAAERDVGSVFTRRSSFPWKMRRICPQMRRICSQMWSICL